MHDHRHIEAHLEHYVTQLKRRGFDFPTDDFLRVTAERRRLIARGDDLRAKANDISRRFGSLSSNKDGNATELAALRGEQEELKRALASDHISVSTIDQEFNDLMLAMPNLPSEQTPDGNSSDDNSVVSHHNQKPEFDFEPLDHTLIGERLGIFDFQRATKLSGARFSILKNAGPALERAIMLFMIRHATDLGYNEVSVPYLVRRDAMIGTGQLPKFESEMFRIAYGDREWFLIPTAEVPVTNLHSDEIINGSDLPLRYFAHTPCFRGEAGSHGRDTKGIIRQHQFNKVELVHFCEASTSWKEYDFLLNAARSCLDALGLHYRQVNLCAADLGFAATFCHDFEVWLPGQQAYREISSCSHYTDFQARRARIRAKDGGAKAVFVHTLNGSAMPIGRTMVALLEQNQQQDGSVVIPSALQPYTGFARLLPGGRTD